MRKTSLLAAVLLSLSFSAAAYASTYTINISGSDTGLLTVAGTTPGADAGSIYLSSGSGVINSHSVTLVPYTGTPSSASPNMISGIAYDDEFYTGFIADGGGGILFTDGTLFYDLFGNADGAIGSNINYLNIITSSAVTQSSNQDTVTASIVGSPTPEPSSMVLLGTGMLGLAGAVRRKLAV